MEIVVYIDDRQAEKLRQIAEEVGAASEGDFVQKAVEYIIQIHENKLYWRQLLPYLRALYK